MCNKRTKLNLAIFLMAAALCMAGVSYGDPMGTAFTYQGRLTDANSPAEGSYDFRFRLYDEAGGGTQLALIKANDIDINDGYITIDLDFGMDPNWSNGNARWLEILLRPGASTGFFTTLSPRQELTPAPYALYAKNAGSDSDWTISGSDMYTDVGVTGNVGIGTTNPVAKLTVDGAILRDGSTMWGSNAETHINLGTNSTTGTNGQDYMYTTVSGGGDNTASGNYATVAGGVNNTAAHYYATVGGGVGNTASSGSDTVSGGESNTTSGGFGAIGGGIHNTVSNYAATVGGGDFNTASGEDATVGGGEGNTASGNHATVAGGANNTASGRFSFAAGQSAKANHMGAFVWGDSTFADFASTANDQFLIRASGGVGIGTTSPEGALDVASTTGAFIVPRMTTTQRDALTAVNGMIIYNTSTNQFNFYENGSWVTK
jgi:hypothetical protein